MRWLWIALAVLLALGIVIWRLRLELYVAFGGGQAAADLTIGPPHPSSTVQNAKKTAAKNRETGKA